ncbi:MAG: alpha/beta hydrolase [Desulfobacterales bacterium]|jgi:acetyl esterase/lipase
MPSFRSKFCRILTKHLVASKFNPNMTIDEMRRSMESLTKFAKLPPKTKIQKISFNGISAEWICTKEAHEGRVILYLHGGGYNIGSPNTHRELAAHISIASGAKVLLPDYRLAPEHPFPSALEDATSAYRWLLDTGLTGGDISIAGESAGGGLSIATSISLRDAGEPSPASIVCISPWTDLEMSGNSIKTHAEIDPMVNLQSLKIMASNYIGDGDPRSPLISPIHADLKGISPLLIHVGSDEMLLDDSTRIAEKAKNAEVDVTLKIYDQMWHAWHLNVRLMPEAKNAIKELGSFIRKHFAN